MKKRIYLAKSSKLIVETRNWMARIRGAGFMVYDWTADPGWADPTEEKRRTGALHDLHEVVMANLFWWHCDEETSEGAAVEFGYALAASQMVPASEPIHLAISGARAVGHSAFFSLHPTVAILEREHLDAWVKIISLLGSAKAEQ